MVLSAIGPLNAQLENAHDKVETALNKTEVPLSSLILTSAGEKRCITVWKQKLPTRNRVVLLKNHDASLKHLKPHDGEHATDPSTFAFIVVTSANEDVTNGDINWMSTECDVYGFPKIRWSTDIVKGDDKGTLYLAIMRSERNRFSLHVYEVNTSKTVARWPIEYDSKTHKEWPEQQESFAKLDRSIHGGCDICGDISQCGIGTTKVTKEGNMLLIQAEREHKGTASIQFTLNLETREWVEKAPAGVKLKPTKGSIWYQRQRDSVSKKHLRESITP